MIAFKPIALPHDDISKGKFTMDTFAADLWKVVTGKAERDYSDRELFFKKTYFTRGLKNIIEVAKERLLEGKGDPIIQLQTPFGGGKTHTLIALYHKAKEWNVNVAVFDGSALDPREAKPWEILEKQLTGGKIEITRGEISPGKEKLSELLSKHEPVLILMDEVLNYLIKAATIKIGESNLASQTLVFIQELTGAVSSLGRVLLVITLPSSTLEHYDESGERMFQKLQKIVGRMEKVYTPVEEDEIEAVIRKRLFQYVDEAKMKEVVREFVEYAKREGLLSSDDASLYEEKFLRSYPFKPEVIEVLYKRWGSIPEFQRTRGVLRLLSLVIYDLMDKALPFIRLGDFNLENEEIRRELLKYIGTEYDSVIASDITSENSGAKRVDNSIGEAYKPYRLGTVVSTTIFMLSFSGRGNKGGTRKEIKLYSSLPEFSSSIIDSVLDELREHLFYLSDEGLYFTNRPNLNRIILNKEVNITREEIVEEERKILETNLSNRGTRFKIYIWPESTKDIPDTPDLKLIILKRPEPDKAFLEGYGENPRIYRNRLIFLCINEKEEESFYGFLRTLLALKIIRDDKTLKLSENQREELKKKINSYRKRKYEQLRKYYRRVFLPAKGGSGFEEIDLGIPTYGEKRHLDEEIYNKLKEEEKILEKLSPELIKEKYLLSRKYLKTKENLLEVFMRTPGELIIESPDVLKKAIAEGVKRGVFGLGYLEGDQPRCRYFREDVTPQFENDEIIVVPDLCKKEEPEEAQILQKASISPIGHYEEPLIEHKEEIKTRQKPQEGYTSLYLKLAPPQGKMSEIMGIVRYLREIFRKCEVKVEIIAEEGYISVIDYENKIEEALKQADIKVEKVERRHRER